jgi:hypothetical protein
MAQRRRAIAGRLRVKCHPGIVGAAQSVQRRQDSRIDRATPVGENRPFNREPGDLVAEPHGHAICGEQPRCQEFLEDRRRAVSDRLQQSKLYARPIRAAASSTARESLPSRMARASTASRAVAGTSHRAPRIPACTTSLAWSGLPPVSR